MHKTLKVAGLALVLALPMAPAVAAEISNLNGQSCGDEMGNWHFVNNQTGGATGGWLTAEFSDGTVWVVESNQVNKSNMHFDVEGQDGTLVSASTSVDQAGLTPLPGRLVLSDFSCEDVKKK
ncbi:MAG TPA: hypothetical protein VFG98_11780 [Intrasporangium sp.]|nr:hypothetical protein [Intrasporangium sp.]